jgi:hypothetical protein
MYSAEVKKSIKVGDTPHLYVIDVLQTCTNLLYSMSLLALIFTIILIIPYNLFAQVRYTVNIPCMNTIDGVICYDQNGSALLVTTNYGTYRPGDGWSEIWFSTFAEQGYTSFLTPSIPQGYQIISANYYCYISGCWGDDIHYNYPVFQMPWETINPALLLTHIDYGSSLDSSDLNPILLHQPIPIANSYTPGWNSTDIFTMLLDDIQNNRVYSQYMLSLQFNSDWDVYDDCVVVHAAGFPTSPYILVEYELIPAPPVIEHEQVASISNDLLPMTVAATIIDDTGISSASLICKIDNEADTTIAMENTFENLYECTINPVLPSSGGHFYYRICATDLDDNASSVPDSGWFDIEFTPTSNVDPSAQSTIYVNLGIYPNPFSASCTIEILDKLSHDNTINIYNIKGQLIKRFIATSDIKGSRSVSWNGDDSSGNQVSEGVYIVKLVNNKGIYTTKLLKLR